MLKNKAAVSSLTTAMLLILKQKMDIRLLITSHFLGAKVQPIWRLANNHYW